MKKIFFILIIITIISSGIYLTYILIKKTKLKEKVIFYKDTINILGVGIDKELEGTSRTDTIILAKLDLKNYNLKLLSIPRDTLVFIPRLNKEDKINHAYMVGGIESTIEVVENFLDLPVDYYITLNYEGFKKIVDLIGGVEVDVDKRMYYVDRRGNLYINLKKGKQLLDGDKAMQYVRFRHDRWGDLTRIERQQKFMKLFFKKFVSIENLPHLPTILGILKDNFTTNFDKLQMIKLLSIAKKIKNIHTETLKGEPININGVSYLKVSDYIKDKTIAEFFYGIDYEENSKIKVAMINNEQTEDISAGIMSNLIKFGFNVEKINDEFNYEGNYIVIPDEDKKEKIKDILNVLNDFGINNFEIIENNQFNEFDVAVIISEDY